jgi:hypothetical protein
MSKRLRPIFWPESVLAFIAGVLALLTAVWPDWIERVTGLNPDAHSGGVEWSVAAGCALAAVLFAAFARREWRRAMTAPSA